MGTMLRDWLGTCLEDKLSAAIEWKKHHPEGAKAPGAIKEEPLDDDTRDMADAGDNPESAFSYDHSNIYINVESSFDVGENTFLQIKDFDASEERFPAVLSDGRTMIRAEFDDDVVRLFEKRHQRRLTQIVGGMINPSEFTIRATPLGDQRLGIVLVIRNFTYRKGSAGTGSAGHPKFAYKLPPVLQLLDSLRMIMLEDMRGDLNPGPEDIAVTIPDDTTDVLRQPESISDPASQVELASQEFATQAPIRDRPKKQIPDLSVAPGTNLARPVKLATTTQKKADPTAAQNLLAMIGLPQAPVQPTPEPPAVPMDIEIIEQQPVGSTPHVINHVIRDRPDSDVAMASKSDITSTVMDADKQSPLRAAGPVDAVPAQQVEEEERVVSPSQSKQNIESEQEQALVGAHPEPRAPFAASVVAQNNVPQSVPKAVEIAVESSNSADLRRPDPKYVKYARRRIDRAQRDLLEKPKSWCPSESRVPFSPYNIPPDLLKELAAAHEETLVSNEDPVGTQRNIVDIASNEDQSHNGNDQDLEKDEPELSQPFSSWSASPEAHLQSEALLRYRRNLGRDGLPVDSSAPEPPASSQSRLDRNELPIDSSPLQPPSSSPSTRSSEKMDLDDDSDVSDNSELAQALPRPLRTEHSLHHQIIKATPVESIANVKAGLKTPTQHSSSIVLDSTARLSGQAQAREGDGRLNQTTSSPAKRPLENPEEAAPKPKKLHKQPIDWGADEECTEDPAKKLQRERSERLHRAREQALAVNSSKSPSSLRLTDPSSHEGAQNPSGQKHVNGAPPDDGAGMHSQISLISSGTEKGQNDVLSRSHASKLTEHRKLAIEQIDMKLGSEWFSSIPTQMRNGAVHAAQLSSGILYKISDSVWPGDSIQDLVSAWRMAIDWRCNGEARPSAIKESKWATLLPRDIIEVTKARKRDIAEGGTGSLPLVPRLNKGKVVENQRDLAFNPSVGVYMKAHPARGVSALPSSSAGSASSQRHRNAFAQLRGHHSLPPRPQSPPRGSAPRESWDDQEYRPRSTPRGSISEQQLPPRSQPSRGSRSSQQSHPSSPAHELDNDQRSRSRSSPRRWPAETTYPDNGSIFAKFFKSYSELKSVKHEREAAGLDQPKRRRIDVLNWKI